MTLTLAAVLLLAGSPGLPEMGPVPLDTVRVFLVRHGQALSNLDPAPALPAEELDRLTDRGRDQATAAGVALRGQGIAAVLSSPAGRARETAERLSAALGGLALEVERDLRPLDLGHAPGGAALDWDERIATWKTGRDPVPADGESLQQVGQRVRKLLRVLAETQGGRSLVLVAHGEVIGAFVGDLKRVPPPQRYPPHVPNGSITVVEAGLHGSPRLLLEAMEPVVLVPSPSPHP